MTIKIHVDGMHCQKCVDKIKRFVGEIQGVEHIDIDLQSKDVHVRFQAPAQEELIKEAIEDAGFELN